MCGIFGLVAKDNSAFPPKRFENTLNRLFTLSETRGKESAGLALQGNHSIEVFKQPVTASKMIRSKDYRNLLATSGSQRPLAVIGHSRLVTDGIQLVHENNQPVIKQGIVGVHNGIIVNTSELWVQIPTSQKEFDIDTEVILALIRFSLQQGKTLIDSIQNIYHQLEGNASLALFFEDYHYLLLVTNNGSVYICFNKSKGIFVFASEKYILKTLIKKHKLQDIFTQEDIFQLKSNSGCLLDLSSLDFKRFSLTDQNTSSFSILKQENNFQIVDHVVKSPIETSNITPRKKHVLIPQDIKEHFQKCDERVALLKRCKRCILPETMPLITFDEEGVCSYCNEYVKAKILGKDRLLEELDKYRRETGQADCIVSLSGGRDSCYSLHYVKRELKLNPIAFTYDWGMVTDLARRNQSRLCGKLGVEHIIVSADITKKRKFIRKNVLAWLKRPDLGIIPLFMAGDKQYFHYANVLKKQTDIRLLIMGENAFEKTNFKTGFCNIKENKDELAYSLTFLNKCKMALYYAKEFLLNPSYLNSSLFDSAWAFVAYYFDSHEYLNLYRYIPWDESQAELLKKEYKWEIAEDTESTWRIGDGTAPFYNYIYYVMAGFTENDTFRSNQIREGVMDRERALDLVREENKPRYESIGWYCDTIAIDRNKTLRAINSAPKLYLLDP